MKRYFFVITAVILTAAFFGATKAAQAAGCHFISDDIGYVCEADTNAPTFVVPTPPEDSLYNDVSYARVNDLTNVYSEPTTAGGSIRNLGDGYLWSTVTGPFAGDDGNMWYLMNQGEYIRAQDARVYPISQFAGVEVNNQPERPFGWMVVDYWYSDEPGAEPAEDAIKLPRYTFVEVYDAVKDDQDWIWYDIGNGRWMRQTYLSLINVTDMPESLADDELWVDVDLYEQTFAAYEGRRMVYAGLISSGLSQYGWDTDEGLFQVWDRWEETKMSGAEDKVDYYFIEDVPYTMYIDRVTEIALHGAYWHDRFGYKHSHGCINMSPYEAEWVFNWSQDGDSEYFWVNVHTSNPDHYMNRIDPLETFSGA